MNFSYYLYLLTFLVFPIIGTVFSKSQTFEDNFKPNKLIIGFFIIHNLAFFLGFSIKGDYADYIIFSIEYFYFILIINWLSKRKGNLNASIRILGTLILIIGFLQGAIGIVMFIIISQDFEADKILNFQYANNQYETRRYSFGFVTQIDIRYTFVTYKNISLLPIEKKIDKSDLFLMNSKLDFDSDKFNIRIRDSMDFKQLQFISSEDSIYTKNLNKY